LVGQQRQINTTGEKERILKESLQNSFTVDELRERLKNNKTALFLDFLRKLKIEPTDE